MQQIQQMFETMLTKLDELDGIEADMKDIKRPLEYARAEIADLKKKTKKLKLSKT